MTKELYTILISLGLALTFNFLFFEKLIGISMFIFAAIFLGAVYLAGFRQKQVIRRTWWLVLLILFFALMPGIRDNGFLIFLNLCAMMGLSMLLAYELTGTPAFIMRFINYLALIIVVPFQMLAGAFSTMTLLGRIHSRVKNRDVWLRVIKGIAMAVPVLLIFGALFSQADMAFSKFIADLNITISERTIHYLILLLFSFTASLCFLSYVFFPKDKPEFLPEKDDMSVQAGRGIEVMIFLGLISALFLMFIAFQITYLFGGETNIVDAGFTYADYARRGFWELLAVTILSLLVLLASDKYTGNRAQAEQSSHDDIESKKDNRFLIPAVIMIVEVGVIIFSALKRLSLYVDAYGMTFLRFYVAGFIIMLLVLFILLAVKFIKSKKENFFAFGALLSVAGFIIVMDLVNPDAFTAGYNIERYNRTGKIDASYMRELSADAESQKIELYNKLEGEDKEVLRELLQKDKDNFQKNSADWQSANLSRARALELLEELRELEPILPPAN